LSQKIDDSDYIQIDIEGLKKATRDITFDIYLQLSQSNFAHVFSKSTGLDYRRLAQYLHKGVTELYILKEDEKAYSEYIQSTVDKIVQDPNLPSEKKIAALLNMTEQNISELFAQLNIPEETAETSKKVIKNYINFMSENPKTLSVLLKLVSHGEYLYYHSIAVSVFSMFIARATGQFDKKMMEIIGLGGFLHDIGCIQLPKDLLDSPHELSPSEWNLMKTHTKIGLSMIEATPNIPDEVRYIVYQHHEEPDGTGYPNGLKGNSIYYPAKIVALADSFSALISKRPFRPAFSLEQAVHIIQTDKGKFDPHLVRLISSVFLRHSGQGKTAA